MEADTKVNITVSVLIANYNGEALLDDCLQSVLGQTSAEKTEIIVHDDTSTDGSLDLLHRRYPEVKVLSSDRNVGFCVANNRMAAVAKGRYLLLLNNDAALFPDAVQTLLTAADEFGPEPVVATVPQYDWESGELVDQGCYLDPFYNPIPNRTADGGQVAMVIGACLFIDRRLWQRIGGFPEWFESIAEDMYLCCAARLLGARVIACGNSGYRHRQGSSFGGSRIRQGKLVSNIYRRRLSERNKTMVMLICTPGIVLMPLLPLHFALLVIEGLVMAATSRSLQPLSGIYTNAIQSIWSDRHSWMAAKKRIDTARKLSSVRYFSAFRPFPRKLQMLIKHGMPKLLLTGQQPRK